MTWEHLLGRRRLRKADVLRIGTPLRKPALIRRINGGCDLALDELPLLLFADLGNRDSGKERLGVGMEPAAEHFLRIGKLHHHAQIHNHDRVGHMAHDGHVVGDEHVGQPQLLLKILHQVDDLCLDRHIQGRNRLVADDELWI